MLLASVAWGGGNRRKQHDGRSGRRRRQGDYGATIFDLEVAEGAAQVEWEALFAADKTNILPEGPHPTDCSVFLNSRDPVSHITPAGMPRDLQSIECRVAWATETEHGKTVLGLLRPSEREEAITNKLKKKIIEICPEVGEKGFTAEEMRVMGEMNPDYIVHMIENPEELKEVVRRYGIAKKANEEDRVAEI